jgi:hypothetical protein
MIADLGWRMADSSLAANLKLNPPEADQNSKLIFPGFIFIIATWDAAFILAS